MIPAILTYIGDLRHSTELLEALNWDEDLAGKFQEELAMMLRAAPPNFEKALFWLKNTPWSCFNNETIPDNVYKVVEKMMLRMARQIQVEAQDSKNQRFMRKSSNKTDEEWN